MVDTPTLLTLRGLNGSTATLDRDALSRLPRRTIHVQKISHPVLLEVVQLSDVLAKVILPIGSKFKHARNGYRLRAQSATGNRIDFTWPAIDPSSPDGQAYIVTGRSGQALSEKAGPLQLIVPGDNRTARWLMNLKALSVERAP